MKKFLIAIIACIVASGSLPTYASSAYESATLIVNVAAEEDCRGDVIVQLMDINDENHVQELSCNYLEGYRLVEQCEPGQYFVSTELTTGDGYYYYAYAEEDVVDLVAGQTYRLNVIAGSSAFVGGYNRLLDATDDEGNAPHGNLSMDDVLTIYEENFQEYVDPYESTPSEAGTSQNSSDSSEITAFPAYEGKDADTPEEQIQFQGSSIERAEEQEEVSSGINRGQVAFGVIVFACVIAFIVIYDMRKKTINGGESD